MRYLVTLSILFLPFIFLSQQKNKGLKLNFSQKKIQSLYKRKKYDRCITIGRKKLNKGNLDRVTYYYLALSCFKLYKSTNKGYLFNRSVRYLDYSNYSTNKLVSLIAEDDKDLLSAIHGQLIELAKKDAQSNIASTKKKVKYALNIFNDSTDYLSLWIPKSKTLNNTSQLSRRSIKKNESIAQELKALFTEGYFTRNSFSYFLKSSKNIVLDKLQAKFVDFIAPYYGMKEIKGKAHNKKVVNLFQELGFTHLKTDETPWCSAFMNFCAKKIGANYPNGLRARNWLKCGVKINTPNVGDIVVFGWGGKNSTAGHVGIYVCKDGDKIYCLGGNQTDEVNITQFCAKDVLGYRKLTLK